MKKLILLLTALITAIACDAQTGAHIEYKISSSKGATGSMMINVSTYGSMSEFNMVIPQMPGGGFATKALIQSSTPDVIYMINDKTKTYSENKKTTAQEDTKTYAVKKLGEETVNGYKCCHAIVTEGSETHEVWNTKEIVDYEKYVEAFKNNKNMSSEKRTLALKEAGCDGFPVKSFHKGNGREGDVTMELVKFEKKNLSKSDFDLPAGYTKNGSGAAGAFQMKSQQEIMNMTTEDRAKYIETLKQQHGK